MNSEVKVGALTLGGGVLLAAVITFLGAFNLFESGYSLDISYPGVAGLKQGGEVRYAGVPIGTVKSMEILPGKVNVKTHINKGIKIPRGSEFYISSDGILGDKFVDIQPPKKVTANYIEEDGQVTGIGARGMDQFMNSSDEVLEKVGKIADALNNVFGDKEVQASMRDGFIGARDIGTNLSRFTNAMADIAEANKGDVSVMLKQMREMSERMNSMAGHMDSMMLQLDAGQAGHNVAVMAASLARTSQKIERVATLLGDVADDPQTKEDMQATLHNVRETTDSAKRMLKVLDGAGWTMDAMHNRGGDWRGNVGVNLNPKPGTYLYVGASGLGDNPRLDAWMTKELQKHGLQLSVGSMQGELGVGAFYPVGKDLHLYTQAYDLDDIKLRLGAEYRLKDDFYLVGETLDALHGNKRDFYMGVRAYF